jgi:hypothetical protein
MTRSARLKKRMAVSDDGSKPLLAANQKWVVFCVESKTWPRTSEAATSRHLACEVSRQSGTSVRQTAHRQIPQALGGLKISRPLHFLP